MASIQTVVAIGVCALSGVLVIGSIWLTIWTCGIPHRALRKTAHKQGVSETYLRAVLANNDNMCAGRIHRPEWERRAMEIAYQFPHDSKIHELLRENEGLQ